MSVKTVHDYIIIGSGPAGLQLGYFLKKAGRNFLILERNDIAGSFYRYFPRQRNLISINKVYTGFEDKEINLRFDWNSLLCDDDKLLFKHYSKAYFPKADVLVKYLNDFTRTYDLPVRYNTEVVRISKEDLFEIYDRNDNVFYARALIMATGWNRPYIPDIPGIEHGVHYQDMSVDPTDYENKRLLIVGKGNSAFETADNLIAVTAATHVCSPHSLKMAWDTHYVGNLRAVNNNFLDTYHLKSQNAVLDADINYIKKDGDRYRVSFTYNNLAGEVEELTYDKILLCTGFRFDDTMFDQDCKPALTIKNRFPDQKSNYESVNVDNLFFAGTITHMRDYKKQASGFIHGFRYNAQALFFMFNQRFHGQPLPSRTINWTPEELCKTILTRINGASSLWQQYGYIGDVGVIDNDDQITYYTDLPIDFMHNQLDGAQKDYFTITLEFGQKTGEATAHHSNTRVHRDDHTNAHLSKFLHPVVRYYSDGRLEEEHHIIEDLDAVWRESVHVDPLMGFLKEKKKVLVSI